MTGLYKRIAIKKASKCITTFVGDLLVSKFIRSAAKSPISNRMSRNFVFRLACSTHFRRYEYLTSSGEYVLLGIGLSCQTQSVGHEVTINQAFVSPTTISGLNVPTLGGGHENSRSSTSHLWVPRSTSCQLNCKGGDRIIRIGLHRLITEKNQVKL